MAKAAALGFSLHTGWAALVVVAGAPGKFEVLLRRRVELLPPGDAIPRFVFHQAAELPAAEAPELIQRAEDASRKAAKIAVKEILDHLRSLDRLAKGAGFACSSKPIPKELATVPRSHPMIHSAEGALFQRAIASACESCGLASIAAREREVWTKAAATWGLTEAALRKQVDGLRKSVGAPWGTDQKTAMAFALLALR
jgi:hypothetical protein